MRIVIFSGTTEGRKVSEYLSRNNIVHDVCVATSSGEYVMEANDFARINVGRLDENEIRSFLCNKNPELVVDATHPYAEIITDNLNKVCSELNIEYMRVNRDSATDCDEYASDGGLTSFYKSAAECAKALIHEDGNILLTTGSKELECYMHEDLLKDRIYVRVLPSIEALTLCRKAGISEKNIIAMYGPHTQEMNEAVIKQYGIKHLVTKESGVTGGFPEKVRAAVAAGVKIHIIERPENAKGCSVSECINRLNELCEIECCELAKLHVKLVGIGPGNNSFMTSEAIKAIENADYVFGAERMLESVVCKGIKIAEYMPDRIIEELEKSISEKGNTAVAAGHTLASSGDSNAIINAVALFSGDTGVYSGATKLYKKLSEWGKCENIQIIPGISSFSYFAAAIGTDYTGAYLESLHGKSGDEENLRKIKSLIIDRKKVFILMSGRGDFEVLKGLIPDTYEGQIIIGYNLSYQDQKIIHTSLHNIDSDVKDFDEGLYIVLVNNENAD